MPIYEFYCHACGCVEESLRPIEDCDKPLGCFNCGSDMTRVFSAPMLLNRSKPGSFKWDRGKLNGWDDRIARLRNVEAEGPQALRKERAMLGKVYDMTLAYKKKKYG